MCIRDSGACRASSCDCEGPWTGPQCAQLRVGSVPAPAVGYGMEPQTNSWGGNVVLVNGVFHMYVAVMLNGCLLDSWKTNSVCVHATSDTAEGPYAYQSTAVGTYCHNPHLLVDSRTNRLVLFHIGNGICEKVVQNCTASPTPCVPNASATGSQVHVATDPDGPFAPLQTSLPGCNNPAPYQHPNGTLYVLCDSEILLRAEQFEGPWVVVANISHQGGPGSKGQDATLYMDPRGNWHVLYHSYERAIPCGPCNSSVVSGHIYSSDGLVWHVSPLQPFSKEIALSDGKVWEAATLERVKLLFGAGALAHPTHIITATNRGPAICPPTPSTDCKYKTETFTMIRPLILLSLIHISEPTRPY
eukprot:TRINITY_DN30033_c0_g1_i1.p1 TRINITY_DN30033_c0_g1~~TRINITY_DN30033_c0_g1_i1.p1  ORF type:complete len:359 (+),score=38.92 TRINITY_DN30033_c0_g1_i1:123-1199(+)